MDEPVADVSEPSTGDGPARERILAAAETLFAEHGFDATPTSKVAERASVPKGLVHYYFRRKPDLLEALVDRLPRDVVRCSEVIVAGDLTASLRRLVVALDESLDDSAVLSHLLWREADTLPVVRDALQRRFDELVAAVQEVIVGATGREASDDVRGASLLLASAIGHRHAMARHAADDTGEMERELAFVVGALTPPGPRARAGHAARCHP
ncbi:helix-turn-helix domain-containing protein [Pseudonocardia sp. KRD291]|uniref:TetR/AcrR family transcriptional regulator n=1 Tax=Pseudonocardia sp. KRD291 TaxID=2792007 RepID=UPI0027E34464|nr:helix-turn-helix domain-containing protein [Pseudonocardia sp. KRD291]